MMEKREDLRYYKDKMEKYCPTPEDMRIFWVGNDLARIEARTTYCLECIMEEKGIVTSMDDTAGLIGYEARLVPDDEKVIIDALMDNNAVLVQSTAEKREAQGGKTDETGKDYTIWDRGYVITIGRDPFEAYVALVELERAAEILQKAEAIGGIEPLSKSQAKREQRRYLRTYSSPGTLAKPLWKKEVVKEKDPEESKDDEAGLGESFGLGIENTLQELKARMDLVEYSAKAVKSNLIVENRGSISVRNGEERMLVTPFGMDADRLLPEDMVSVSTKTLRYSGDGNHPTDESDLHAGIYKARPDVGAIVHAHSLYCSVFAACKMPMEINDLSLRWDLGFMVYASKYGETGSSTLTRNVVEALGDRPCCIISNHGMIACGKDLEQAFQVALSLEDAARRFLNERQIKLVEKEQNKQVMQEEFQGPVTNQLMIIEEPKK